MDERYIDLIKMMWNEMNPIDGYTSHRINMKMNNRNKDIADYVARVLENNLNDIYELDFDNRVYNRINQPDLRRVNIPQNVGKEFGNGMWRNKVVPNEYVKDINGNWSRIKNRIPNVTMGKLVNKILNEPIVKFGSGALKKSVIPLSILEGIGLNTPVY